METWCRLTVPEEYEKNPKLSKEIISELRSWLESQEHLPQSLSDLDLIFHIQSCDYDLEMAKKTLDLNYTMRTKVEFFNNRDPHSKEIEIITDCLHSTLIKEVDSDGNIALVIRLNDTDPSKYNFNHFARDITMVLDLIRLEHGTVPGIVGVMDIKGFGLAHMFKAPLGSVASYLKYLQHGLPTKIKSIQVINTGSSVILDKIMALIKLFLSEKMCRMINIHHGYDTLYDHGLNRNKMPEEYGGNGGALRELARRTHDMIKTYAGYFREEQSLRVDESKRPRNKYFGIF